MRPLVVSAILLLVALMHMAEANVATISRICNSKYPDVKCNVKDWYRLDNKRCMKIYVQFLTFSDAEKRCKADGGQLVSIHNLDNYDRVLCNMFRFAIRKQVFWIGARRGRHGFYWVDGSGRMGFSRWASRQPDNWFFREHCVEMNYGSWGRWNDENCYSKRPFMCAKNM
uniref:C-type lectin lectoxin-Lio2-like n=1 Tax=Scatophagus argus TaxID=75038 RepID=UPI001ED84512|nr:C-type lectin lectoxin-Lio2-like [Scatophagus argus]XP_046269869.1 C-type lectin lectoxin-Lio2-like [Scatophagus argus]